MKTIATTNSLVAAPVGPTRCQPPTTEPSPDTELVTDTTSAYWAARINRLGWETTRLLIELGQELWAAKAKLKHGQWVEMFKTKQIKLNLTLAQRLMKVARHPALADAANLPSLPNSPSALVKLSKLPQEVVEAGIAEGHISPGMTIVAAAQFVREHQPAPGGDNGGEDGSAQQPGAASKRNEFLVILWDDSGAATTRAPEKSYPESVYPHIAFFRFYEAGNTSLDSSAKYGFTHVTLFAVPVEQTLTIKDKQGRPICKATCRLLSLLVRGDVPEPAVVPAQIVKGGYEGVLKMISCMFPDALKVVSTSRGEAPKGWDFVPRECKDTSAPKPSEPASDSTTHTQPVGAVGTSLPAAPSCKPNHNVCTNRPPPAPARESLEGQTSAHVLLNQAGKEALLVYERNKANH